MGNLAISLAVADYDHTRDLAEGTVRVEGVDLIVLRLKVEEIFHRFMRNREFDVAEMSFAKVIALAAQGDRSLVALPVFPRRVFRHSAIYVRADAGIDAPEQLAGRSIGVPEWAQTAGIYARAVLAHDYGLDLASIRWFQAGVNDPGRAEKVKLELPAGLSLTPVRDRSLSQMLLTGDIDAAITARPPAPFVAGDARVRRLFADFRAAEQAWWEKTEIFPIMHVVAMRRDVHERAPWLAMNLCKAFEQAKSNSLARITADLESYLPLPWTPAEARLARERLGPDFWPYGVDANRTTLEAFARFACEQGVCARALAPQELFPPEVQDRHRI
jgi:4,5-dihydroxyphthalate decarboxylase